MRCCFPHSRGDVPLTSPPKPMRTAFSPLTWGCSERPDARHHRHGVFPTHVGMFRRVGQHSFYRQRFPHSRGDVPFLDDPCCAACSFSPLTWGCSAAVTKTTWQPVVFPTHVGMFRGWPSRMNAYNRFPHSRGDVPETDGSANRADVFSPLTWGCSWGHADSKTYIAVFPTHVGMFRILRLLDGRENCFPHSRGDVPLLVLEDI